MADLCLFCGEPAVAWCDGVIALVKAADVTHKGVTVAVTDMDAMLSTPYMCNAALCEAHLTQVGWIHGSPEVADSIDHCPKCRERTGHVPCLPSEEIYALRRGLHAQWRRERIKAVS